MQISGYTIVRNALKLDYPFRESVQSMLPLCDELVINCGDSSDGTRQLCDSLAAESGGKIRVIDSVWETREQSGGFQLKAQSDRALAECRAPWCLYLQADEVLHEEDYPRIRSAMSWADGKSEVDGLLFDYLHFYGNFAYVIRGRNWYRREVRLLKNFRGIQSFRDAQGFRRRDGSRVRVIRADVRVYHYGYVRSSESLGRKSAEMSQWWGEAPVTNPQALQLHRHVGLTRFTRTHPKVMRDRIALSELCFDPMQCERKWDRNEIKNALTLAWEKVFPFRIGEYRNYEMVRA